MSFVTLGVLIALPSDHGAASVLGDSLKQVGFVTRYPSLKDPLPSFKR
jgi:hypothetical protein